MQMRPRVGALVVLLLTMMTQVAAQRLTMAGTNYSVHMPGPAECSDSTVDTPVGKQDFHICSYFDTDALEGFAIQYVLIPETSQGVDPKLLLEGGRAGAALMSNCEVVRETSITVDGYPGLESVLRTRDSSHVGLTRFVITDRHMIIVSADGTEKTVNSARARAFVESLQIRNRAL